METESGGGEPLTWEEPLFQQRAQAGLGTNKALNCEQLHRGAWETQAQRDSCDPFGTSRASPACFNTLCGRHLGYLVRVALFLEIYDACQSGSWLICTKVMLWEPSLQPYAPQESVSLPAHFPDDLLGHFPQQRKCFPHLWGLLAPLLSDLGHFWNQSPPVWKMCRPCY